MLFVGCLILVKMCACHSKRDPEWLPTYSEPQNWFLWWLRINTYRRTEGTEGTCSSEIQSTSPLSPSPPSLNQSFFCATSTTSPFWGRPDDTATCHPVIYMGEVGGRSCVPTGTEKHPWGLQLLQARLPCQRQPPCPARMKGNKAVGDTSIVCVHKLAWNRLGAANCRMELWLRGKKILVRFKRNSRTGRTDEGRAGPIREGWEMFFWDWYPSLGETCGCGTDSRRGRVWCPRYQVLAVMGTSTSSRLFLPLPVCSGQLGSRGGREGPARMATHWQWWLNWERGALRATDMPLEEEPNISNKVPYILKKGQSSPRG